jgi:hypothetical protein
METELKNYFLKKLENPLNTQRWVYYLINSVSPIDQHPITELKRVVFDDLDLTGLKFTGFSEHNLPTFQYIETSEPTEVQFEEQEILLEEIDFFKDKVDTVTVKSFNDVLEFISKVRDETSKSLGIPPKYLQNNGYPSTKTQMSDTDKEMLNKA